MKSFGKFSRKGKDSKDNEEKNVNTMGRSKSRLSTNWSKSFAEESTLMSFNNEATDFDAHLNLFLSQLDGNKSISVDDDDTESGTETTTILEVGRVPLPLEEVEKQSGSQGQLPAEKNHDLCQELNQWLETIGMEQYHYEFLFNGYDNIRFLKNIISADDLNNMSVREENDIYIILDNVNSLPNPPAMDIASPELFDCKYLLKLCQLECYIEQFQEQGYETFEKLSKLSYFSMVVIFNITYIGHRKRILYYVEEACRRFISIGDELPSVVSGATHVRPSGDSLDSNQSNITETGSISSKAEDSFTVPPFAVNEKLPVKTFTPPARPSAISVSSLTSFSGKKARKVKTPQPPPTCTSVEEDAQAKKQADASKSETISKKLSKTLGSLVKKVTQKSTSKNIENMIDEDMRKKRIARGTPIYSESSEPNAHVRVDRGYRFRKDKMEGRKTIQNLDDVWIHIPSQLFRDTVIVECMFLGMHKIDDIKLRGKALVQDCVEKLKLRSANQTKMPLVSIIISAFNVTIKNKVADTIICIQKIPCILLCSQDKSDQRVFCYLYHEASNHQFLCNVFRCNSVKQSAEAVLAIGFAFQLCPEN